MHNRRLQIQLDTTGANAEVAEVAQMEPMQNPPDRAEQPEPVPEEPEPADVATASPSWAPAPVVEVTRALHAATRPANPLTVQTFPRSSSAT